MDENQSFENANISAAPGAEGPGRYGKKNTPKNGFGVKGVIAVALICSLLGSGISFLAYQYVLPMRYPVRYQQADSTSDYLKLLDERQTDSSGDTSSAGSPAQQDVVNVAGLAAPSVVGIMAYPPASQGRSSLYESFFGTSQQTPSEGSGIIISADGYIATNSHVIETAIDDEAKIDPKAKIEVYLPEMMEDPVTAEFIGWDRKTDLAVLKIAMTNLPAITFADSSKIRVGESVVAIGNPGGL
ncbi:MAG TPA: hypothetical protein DD727_05850, partial [Clostridiales bacterium]|nr:hypothetical protein [Clostridiales bacterium]